MTEDLDVEDYRFIQLCSIADIEFDASISKQDRAKAGRYLKDLPLRTFPGLRDEFGLSGKLGNNGVNLHFRLEYVQGTDGFGYLPGSAYAAFNRVLKVYEVR